MANKNNTEVLKHALLALAPHYRKVVCFGLFTNLMVLAPSWYMLEVYDRVIFSRNLGTLLMLTTMVVFIYFIMESLERVRRQLMLQAAAELDQALEPALFHAAANAKLAAASFPAERAFGDYRNLRELLVSPALLGLIDIPFVVIFLTAIFMIHSSLGWLALLGLAIQTAITVFNQWRVQPLLQEANQFALAAQQAYGNIQQHAEVVTAMGMQARLEQRWQQQQHAFLAQQAQASDIAGKYAAYAKMLQVSQASLVLGLACYLLINQSLANGAAMMIVASILAARVLAPFSQVIGQWRTLAQAWQAYGRLDELLLQHPLPAASMALPRPSGAISVENLSYALADNPREPLLRNLNFQLAPGEVLLITGPSASGKTTLTRLLVGLLPSSTGKVRFDGVDAYRWDKAELGPSLGYLPQEIELLDGSIAENICRFGAASSSASASTGAYAAGFDVAECDAEKLASVVQLLKMQPWLDTLPEGLNTQIGSAGLRLPGGRRQLIGLARAFYGEPAIVVLDEPNANLDETSEQVLLQAVLTLKSRKTTVVIVSHLQNVMQVADQMLLMVRGQMLRYGKPQEVMASLQQSAVPGRAA